MGCLVEILGELFVEIVLGGIFYIYSGLMSLIIPRRFISEAMKKRMKNVIKVVTAVFIMALVVGCVLLLTESPAVILAGKIIVFFVASVSALQILLGIVVVILTKKKNKWKRK